MNWLSNKRRSDPAATFVRLKPSVDISFTALIYFGATLFIGVAALNSQTNLLFGVFGMMIGVLLVAGYVSRFSLRKLNVRRVIPEYFAVGEPSSLSYSITNTKRYWPSVSVALGEIDGCDAFTQQPYAYVLHVAAGLTTSVSVPLLPKRRGMHELNCHQISTSFPFGFVKRAIECKQKETIIVFPAIAQVNPAILLLCHSAVDSGARMRPRKGGSDEFFGVKEYREGENPRLIHWRLSARAGDLVVKEMTRVAPPCLLIVVDNYRATGGEEARDELEKALSMAASLASMALGLGYPVGMFAWSGGFLHMAPDRGKRHRRELLTAMARLEANPLHHVWHIVEHAMALVTPGTTIVVFTPGASRADPRSRRRSPVVTLSTRNPEVLRYFQFRETVDFRHSMPMVQEDAENLIAEPELLPEEREAVKSV